MDTLRRALWATLGSALVAAVVVVGCSEDEPAEPAASAERAGEIEASGAEVPESVGRAKRAAKQLGKTLKGRLQAALDEGGPARAIDVCADEAQELTAEVAESTGVTVGRSSLKLRNPDNTGPAWVRAWLEEQGQRPAEGVQPVAKVEDGEARFIAPIPVEGLCVTCHGPRDALPEEVREVLSERYPQDEAVGYEVGDLRGAIWATAPAAD